MDSKRAQGRRRHGGRCQRLDRGDAAPHQQVCLIMHSVMGLKGLEHTLGHGKDRIRYLSPVPAGSRLRGRVNIAEAEDVPPNGLRVLL